MASKLDMPLADVIKMNKKKPSEGKGQKGFAKGKFGGRKFKRPVRAGGRNKSNDKPDRHTNNTKDTKPRKATPRLTTTKFIRRTNDVVTRPARETKSNDKTSLRISNLDFNITHKDLMDLFSQFGPIVKNKIDFDELGRSKGTAIVQYQKPESAKKAIEEYDGATLDGKQLIVEFTRSSSSRPQSEVPGIRHKIIKKTKDRNQFTFNRRGSFSGRGTFRGSRRGHRGRK